MDGVSFIDMVTASFNPKRVVALVGPTSSGKSGLALKLCRKFPFEIICMDSMQVYKELQIGTSRPCEAETSEAPHHLYGAYSIRKPLTTVGYVEAASQIMKDIQKRGKVPLLVGGTGLYMRALFEGLDKLPSTPAGLRKRLNKSAARRGAHWLYRMLQRLDSKGAAHLHVNDTQRVQRFLEVRILTGKSMLDAWSKSREETTPPVAIGLQVERPVLNGLIENSVNRMLRGGWIEETKALKDNQLMQYVFDSGPLGYRQVHEYLANELTYEKMEGSIVVATRRYAKRQMTWFRKVSYIQWFPFDPNSGYNVKDIMIFLGDRLG